MGAYLTDALLILGLIVVNGYFAAAEIALISARRAQLTDAASKGSRGAEVALKLTEDPSKMLAAIQIGITLVGFMASATAAVSLAQPLGRWMASLGIPYVSAGARGLSVLLVTLLIAYLTLVMGELAPKRLGLQKAEVVARSVSRPIDALSRAAAPLTWLLSRSTDVVARLLGVIPGEGRPGVSEEEIKLLVTEQGSLLEEEKRMIHEIFELGDTVAREIMVPRVDMAMIDDTTSSSEALERLRRSGFSRLPVYHEDPDSIVGVVLLKDLVGPAAAGELDSAVVEHVRPPLFVPETKRILELLSDMQTIHNHMAIVVDEYGGTAGLVTIEDIVEEIIGEVADEFDIEHRYITQMGADEWVIDGRLSVEEARENLGVPLPESDEYETVAGWMLSELGHIPVPGETLRAGGFVVEVLVIRRRAIARLGVKAADESREQGGEAVETPPPVR